MLQLWHHVCFSSSLIAHVSLRDFEFHHLQFYYFWNADQRGQRAGKQSLQNLALLQTLVILASTKSALPLVHPRVTTVLNLKAVEIIAI